MIVAAVASVDWREKHSRRFYVSEINDRRTTVSYVGIMYNIKHGGQ